MAFIERHYRVSTKHITEQFHPSSPRLQVYSTRHTCKLPLEDADTIDCSSWQGDSAMIRPPCPV